MKRVLSAAILSLAANLAFAQQVLLHEDVRADTVKMKFGPNRTHYVNVFFGSGFTEGKPDTAGADIVPWSSGFVTLGARYKLKLSRMIAIGSELYYQRNYFHLKQEQGKAVPDTMQHNKEKLIFNNACTSFYLRLNLDKRRGDRFGTYIDLGAYGSLVVLSVHKTHDEFDSNNSSKASADVREYHLNYTQTFEDGFFFKFGRESLALVACYRMSDLFRKDRHYPELPRVLVGLELNFN